LLELLEAAQAVLWFPGRVVWQPIAKKTVQLVILFTPQPSEKGLDNPLHDRKGDHQNQDAVQISQNGTKYHCHGVRGSLSNTKTYPSHDCDLIALAYSEARQERQAIPQAVKRTVVVVEGHKRAVDSLDTERRCSASR